MQTEYPPALLSEGLRIQSMINSTGLIVPDELDDLNQLRYALSRQSLEFRDIPNRPMPVWACGPCSTLQAEGVHKRCYRCALELETWNNYMSRAMAAIRRGEVRHTKVYDQHTGCNEILRAFYVDFFARLMGSSVTPGLNQTLFIEYFALGTSYAPTSFTQTQLGNEIYRTVPQEFYEDGISTFYATSYLKKTEGNPTGNTTVASATSTELTLTSATGFVSGCRVQVETVNATYTFTGTLSGSVLTASAITGGGLDNASAFDASDIPQPGDTVIVLHSEGACFIGGDASASPNTGKPMNRRLTEILKTHRISRLYDYVLACTSVR